MASGKEVSGLSGNAHGAGDRAGVQQAELRKVDFCLDEYGTVYGQLAVDQFALREQGISPAGAPVQLRGYSVPTY